jgi:hypothetical protein
MISCDAIRQRLAGDGIEAAETDEDIRRHLETCEPCTRFLDSLRKVETALADLPVHDAPDGLVADTLSAVRRAAGEDRARESHGIGRRYFAPALAASVVIAASLVLTVQFLDTDLSGTFGTVSTYEATGDGVDLSASLDTAGRANDQPAPPASEPESELRLFEMAELEKSKDEPGDYRSEEEFRFRMADLVDEGFDDGSERWEYGERLDTELDIIALLEKRRGLSESDTRLDEDTKNEEPETGLLAELNRQLAPEAAVPDKGDVSGDVSEFYGTDSLAAGEAGGEALESPAKTRPVGGSVVSGEDKERSSGLIAAQELARLQAMSFLDGFRSLDGLVFRDPAGYWSNSYIPGDPAMRLLHARLAAWNRAVLGAGVRLEQDVRQIRQPFDAPEAAALALYLHADTAAIDGPTRLRIQIGVKGAERQGGHRPAMNIGLVVDLRSVADADTRARIRALITALERARQPEDRFSLTVAGPSGGLLVAPEQFRHGPLRLAMDRMFGASPDGEKPALDLPRALAAATESVRQGDDPASILGSSLVLLVTGSSLAGDLAVLEGVAHRNAIGGVPLSVVALGAQGDLAHIDRLVAAGQGNRRILDAARAADALIERELRAASQAVARALRLRIRLAPGVRLIGVLGSQPLAELEAERVREAEQAIDQRLARNLGIEADRGEDEEGIQIVIPNFYAGDSHVILLDVVAERPGPVAEVTLRYKDVVYLRNGVAHAGLAIDGGQAAPGPLELNVIKNLAAREFARQTREVSRSLAAGDARAAALRVAALRDLLRGLRLEVPGLASDPDLAADEAMLEEYLAVLNSPAAQDAGTRRYLADSLLYAGFRKLHRATR